MKTKSNPTFLPIKDKGTKHGTTSVLLAVIVVMSNQVSCIGRLQFSQNKRQRNHRNCSSACSQRSWVSQIYACCPRLQCRQLVTKSLKMDQASPKTLTVLVSV